jgi:hypothetical protein
LAVLLALSVLVVPVVLDTALHELAVALAALARELPEAAGAALLATLVTAVLVAIAVLEPQQVLAAAVVVAVVLLALPHAAAALECLVKEQTVPLVIAQPQAVPVLAAPGLCMEQAVLELLDKMLVKAPFASSGAQAVRSRPQTLAMSNNLERTQDEEGFNTLLSGAYRLCNRRLRSLRQSA